jgi:hypothetical protein
MTILFAYDGSESADAAIAAGGKLLTGARGLTGIAAFFGSVSNHIVIPRWRIAAKRIELGPPRK